MSTFVIRPIQLRMARAALNWTVRDLEKKSQIGRNTISRYEAGHDVLLLTVRGANDNCNKCDGFE